MHACTSEGGAERGNLKQILPTECGAGHRAPSHDPRDHELNLNQELAASLLSHPGAPIITAPYIKQGVILHLLSLFFLTLFYNVVSI